jgi:hypothetical protein
MEYLMDYGIAGILALFIILHFKFLLNDRKHEHLVRKEEVAARKENNEVLRDLSRAVTLACERMKK